MLLSLVVRLTWHHRPRSCTWEALNTDQASTFCPPTLGCKTDTKTSDVIAPFYSRTSWHALYLLDPDAVIVGTPSAACVPAPPSKLVGAGLQPPCAEEYLLSSSNNRVTTGIILRGARNCKTKVWLLRKTGRVTQQLQVQ